MIRAGPDDGARSAGRCYASAMQGAGAGLTGLSTTDLERILRALHRGQLECPIGHAELHMAGLSYLVDRIGALRGLDERAVRAVVVAVLAERKRR